MVSTFILGITFLANFTGALILGLTAKKNKEECNKVFQGEGIFSSPTKFSWTKSSVEVG